MHNYHSLVPSHQKRIVVGSLRNLNLTLILAAEHHYLNFSLSGQKFYSTKILLEKNFTGKPWDFNNIPAIAEIKRNSKFSNQSDERLNFLNRHSKFPNRHSILVIPQQTTARIPLVIKIESLRRCAKQHFHSFYLSRSMIVAYINFVYFVNIA